MPFKDPVIESEIKLIIWQCKKRSKEADTACREVTERN